MLCCVTCTCVCLFPECVCVCVMILLQISQPFLMRYINNYAGIHISSSFFSSLLHRCAWLYMFFGIWHVYASHVYFYESDTIKCCFSFFTLFKCIVSFHIFSLPFLSFCANSKWMRMAKWKQQSGNIIKHSIEMYTSLFLFWLKTNSFAKILMYYVLVIMNEWKNKQQLKHNSNKQPTHTAHCS